MRCQRCNGPNVSHDKICQACLFREGQPISHKALAGELYMSLASAYRHYPVVQPSATQADAWLLRAHGMTIRGIAKLLGVTKDRVFRWLSS